MRRAIFCFVISIATVGPATPAGSPLANSPMVPFTAGPIGPGWSAPMIPNEGGAMIPNEPGAVVPPPTCSNAFDFSDGCNSQYLGMIRI